MKKTLIITCALILGAATSSFAQLTYPGSLWSVNGTAGAAEPGNRVTRTHAEQAIAKAVPGGELSLVAETTLVADTTGYDWNRAALVGGLVRYTYKLPLGVVRVNVGMERERRFTNPRTLSGFVYSADMWMGWYLKGNRK